MLLGDVDLLERLPLVRIGPVVDDWSEGDSPLSLVESQLFITHRSETLELVDDLVRVKSLHRSVNVSGQAKRSWHVGVWDPRHESLVVSHLAALRHSYHVTHGSLAS